MAQTSGFDPTFQVKTCCECKMFDVANWVACLNRENGPRMDRNHFSTPRVVAESTNMMKGADLQTQKPLQKVCGQIGKKGYT